MTKSKKQKIILSSTVALVVLGLIVFLNRQSLMASLFGAGSDVSTVAESNNDPTRPSGNIDPLGNTEDEDDESDDEDSKSDDENGEDSKTKTKTKDSAGVVSKSKDGINSGSSKPGSGSGSKDSSPKPKPAPKCTYPSGSSIETMVGNLATVWSINFMPNCDILVGEREGTLLRTDASGTRYKVAGVNEVGESGLRGVTLHPNFENNNYIYLYYTTGSGASMTNELDRAKLVGNKLADQTTILGGIPSQPWHNGGGIAFGPDGKLYITTGDAMQPELAQDIDSMAGKILRLNPNGSVPSDNPFSGSYVWSYGHRNPQGIGWDSKGQMWSVEHGPSARDEVNRIVKGGNYGWPVITGDQTQSGMRSPFVQSGSTTWAPAQMVVVGSHIYFTGLAGQSIYRVDTNSTQPVVSRYLANEHGRLRAITVKGNSLYVGTSNQDTYGSGGADKVMRVPLSLF